MLYLKTILQDDIMAKNEEKKFNLLKSSKFNEKNNIYHSMFKNDINSVVLIDGYSFNGKILYATPNFPFLYKFNGKEIINTQIEEILPNFIQPFHKDLVENCLRYSNITDVYNNIVNTFLKGKNNTLYNINIYVKPVPNLTYGLIYFVLITKILDHEFIMTLDKDFKIDGFTEMNQGNSFTLNGNQNNNYFLTSSTINHHIGFIIPEFLLHICYKDNCYYMTNNNIDIKGYLYSLNNFKDLEQKLNILLEIIKKKGFLNIDEETEEGKKILNEYNEFKRYINAKQARCFSIFFKVITKKFLNGKYRYHRLYITNDPLSLNENFMMEQTINISESEDWMYKKKETNRQVTLGTFKGEKFEFDENNKGSNKNINNFTSKYYNKDSQKAIKLKIPVNKQIKNANCINEKKEDNDVNNDNNLDKDNIYQNKISKTNTLREQMNIDSTGFNKLKNGIINKKDSIQIIFMKYVSFIFVVITVILVFYDYLSSNKLYSELVQYLKENLEFTHSKIITSCVYITSINIKWVKYKYIDDYSCLHTCSIFYMKILEKCINNINNVKNSFFNFDEDFQEIILKRRALYTAIYNTNATQQLNLDVNDYLNYIISKGIKLIGAYEDYLNFYGIDRINMENLVHQSYEYFNSDIEGFLGDEKLSKVNGKFQNNYLTIIIGTILCMILLAIFSYFIFDFNQLEIFFIDKLINFSSPNFENYLKNLEDLKKKLKNYKNEEEENNVDEMEMEMNSKNEAESKKNNSKSKVEKKNDKNKNNVKDVKDGEEQESKKMNKKRGNKQNKMQQQRIKKKKVMSFYFYKENILFAVKTSLILICFVSFFVVSFIVYKKNLKQYLEFDAATNDVENLYYEFRIFLIFKFQLAKYQETKNYTTS